MSGMRRCANRLLVAPLAVLVAGPVLAEGPACGLVEVAPADALLSVPFRVIDGRIYVDARVNGQGPFPFAVDTGASGEGRADASLIARLKLAVSGSSQTSDGVSSARVDTVRLASVDLGGFVRRDLEVITRDYASRMAPEAAFAGIIGRDFFADGLLVIDYPRRRLSFTRAHGLEGSTADVLAYDRPFRVPVTIGTITTEGQLDTGANVAFVLPRALFDRAGGGAIEAAADGTLTNGAVKTGRATVAGPFRIGAATLSDVPVRVSATYPELLVGAHALQQFALLIDQRSKRVALCPPAPLRERD